MIPTLIFQKFMKISIVKLCHISAAFKPLITLPTRLSNSLIDNIFANSSSQLLSGIHLIYLIIKCIFLTRRLRVFINTSYLNLFKTQFQLKLPNILSLVKTMIHLKKYQYIVIRKLFLLKPFDFKDWMTPVKIG